MIGTRTAIILAVLTGVALELGVHAMSGRREAWDSAEFWTMGLPIAGLVSAAIGVLSRGRDWIWTVLVAPGQVLTMMARSGEFGTLWPLTLILSAILSVPFVAAAFVGSRFRPRPARTAARALTGAGCRPPIPRRQSAPDRSGRAGGSRVGTAPRSSARTDASARRSSRRWRCMPADASEQLPGKREC